MALIIHGHARPIAATPATHALRDAFLFALALLAGAIATAVVLVFAVYRPGATLPASLAVTTKVEQQSPAYAAVVQEYLATHPNRVVTADQQRVVAAPMAADAFAKLIYRR